MRTALIATVVAGVVAYTVQPIGCYLLRLVRPPVAVALVGYGCGNAPGPVYAAFEDDFPACLAVERVRQSDVPACELARILPTDANIEACIGRPWYE